MEDNNHHDGGELHLPDGMIPGSEQAKAWWMKNIEANLKKDITPEMKAKYGTKVVGAYQGKPLVPGEAGKGQGDFNYIRDKLMVTKGVNAEVAQKLTAKAYGDKK